MICVHGWHAYLLLRISSWSLLEAGVLALGSGQRGNAGEKKYTSMCVIVYGVIQVQLLCGPA